VTFLSASCVVPESQNARPSPTTSIIELSTLRGSTTRRRSGVGPLAGLAHLLAYIGNRTKIELGIVNIAAVVGQTHEKRSIVRQGFMRRNGIWCEGTLSSR
jgi:hypothetical protein